jgi:hypothetical protein
MFIKNNIMDTCGSLSRPVAAGYVRGPGQGSAVVTETPERRSKTSCS